MGREALINPQPLPTPGKVLVKEAIPYYYDIAPEVRADCIYKMEASEVKYGSPLMTNNGREPYLDAYTDLIDTINYTIQIHQELQVEGRFDREIDVDLLTTIDRLGRLAKRYRYQLEEKGILDRE